MKKVINGALYNTETATALGSWDNGLPWNDFNHANETLYRTKSGKYFLYGVGGPATKYAESCGQNSWSGGSHIEPLSPETAREWAEKHLNAGEYSAIFGEPEEAPDEREALNLTVPAEIKRKLLSMREQTGKSISQIVTELVEKC